jgi:fimbrial chaperone protein
VQHRSLQLALAQLLLGAFVVAAATAARASSFALNPTTLTFATTTSGDVVIANLGSAPLRLSVRTYAWRQSAANPEELAPSENVPYFPRLLTVQPGSAQRVRVGVLDPRGAVERAYRLIVSELPDGPAADPHSAGLQIVERIDVPLFLPAKAAAVSEAAVAQLRRHGDGVDVELSNTGNVHVPQSEVEVTLRDEAGRKQWATARSAFYVLAQSRISVHLPVPAGALRASRRVDVIWKRNGAPPVTRSFELG